VRLTFDLRGVPEAQQLLGELQGAALTRRVKLGLREGAKVGRSVLKEVGRTVTGSRRVGQSASYRALPGLAYRVRPRHYLAAIMEKGAEAHAIPITRGQFAGRTIAHPGFPARPFMDQAFDRAAEPASDAVMAELSRGL
jgi:hypothetical protein